VLKKRRQLMIEKNNRFDRAAGALGRFERDRKAGTVLGQRWGGRLRGAGMFK
jgi:hypothetical protein